jgi:hypothetical protein
MARTENRDNVKILIDVYFELFNTIELKQTHLTELADMLSAIVHLESPWTWKYLYNLLKGYQGFRVTDKLARALQILANQLDGQSEIQARARPVIMLAINGAKPNSVILGHTIRCQYCQLKFVPVVPWQKYCCVKHKKKYYRSRGKING